MGWSVKILVLFFMLFVHTLKIVFVDDLFSIVSRIFLSGIVLNVVFL